MAFLFFYSRLHWNIIWQCICVRVWLCYVHWQAASCGKAQGNCAIVLLCVNSSFLSYRMVPQHFSWSGHTVESVFCFLYCLFAPPNILSLYTNFWSSMLCHTSMTASLKYISWIIPQIIWHILSRIQLYLPSKSQSKVKSNCNNCIVFFHHMSCLFF